MKLLLLFLSLGFTLRAGAEGYETFKMYPQKFTKVNKNCDVYRELVFTTTSAYGYVGYSATLTNKLGNESICKIMVHPKKKTYELQPTQSIAAGVTVFRSRDGAELTDWRNRGGRARKPAIVFREPSEAERVLYSVEE